MAEESEEGGSKTEEPTARKLQQAREKGDVVKTQDLGSFASLAAAAAVLIWMGESFTRRLVDALIPFIANPGTMNLEGNGSVDMARQAGFAALPIIGTVMAAAAIAGAASCFLQTGVMFSPDKLKPDFKKVSPGAGLKRMFGIDGLMQFVKSVVKMALIGAIGWWVVKPHLTEMEQLARIDPVGIMPFMVDVLKRLVFAVAGVLLIIAGADWLWQRQRFMARMRMTKEELKEDYKQSEGDPHVKARQRQIRNEKARRRMMQAVPEATVVVMNPTHYAVALKYEQGETAAPICVAKGLDSLALRIREVAEGAGVPVIEDPPLARALYAVVEIDEMIPPAHFEAVAKIIGFILGAGRKAAARHS